MPKENEKPINRISGAAGWVIAIIAIAGILINTGIIYSQICLSSETNTKQDTSITTLERDMAVMKATTDRTASDVDEIKKDVKTLLGRRQ